jgi:hypothetical protein
MKNLKDVSRNQTRDSAASPRNPKKEMAKEREDIRGYFFVPMFHTP